MSVYSTKTLTEKLGIKEGIRGAILNAPKGYVESLGLSDDTLIFNELRKELDYVHFFTKSQRDLREWFPKLKAAIAYDGMVWVSWPKGSSKVSTDLNENKVMNIGSDSGLVDVKVIAVDETWSGLKFVYRMIDRP
jgi:hypothetical protein